MSAPLRAILIASRVPAGPRLLALVVLFEEVVSDTWPPFHAGDFDLHEQIDAYSMDLLNLMIAILSDRHRPPGDLLALDMKLLSSGPN